MRISIEAYSMLEKSGNVSEMMIVKTINGRRKNLLWNFSVQK